MSHGCTLYIDGSKVEGAIAIPDGVTSIGDYAFFACTGLTSVTIPDSVTSIGNYAFYNCEGLTSVTIGSSVESIGEDAFRYCYKLVEVYNKSSLNITAGSSSYGYAGYYAKNVYTEENGSWLTDTADGYCFLYDGAKGYLVSYYGEATDISLPDSFTAYDGTIVNSYEINRYAFYGNTALTSVTISDSVTSIGESAFEDCTGLTSVTIGSSVESIGEDAFRYCYKLVEVYNKSSLNITAGDSSYGYVGYYAKNVYTEENGSWFTDTADGYRFIYDGAKGYLVGYYGEATAITLPDSFTAYDGTTVNSYEIYKYAFYKNTALTSVTIGNSVESIGEDTFWGCTGLTSVTIGNSVESIGEYAFYNCTGLASVTIPDSVTSIGYDAFSYCTQLTSVTIGNSVTSIGSSAFRGCKGLTSVTIGNSVESIGSYAFSGCTGLTEINWNAVSVENFNSNINVFYNAGTAGEGIAVTFGDGVEKIPAYLFYVSNSSYRPNTKNVIIGSNVTSIGWSAFGDCTGLTSVVFEDTEGWQLSQYSSFGSYTSLSSADLANTSTAATYLKSTYRYYYWRKVK